MMEYGRDPKTFSLPKKDGARRRVMKLGEEGIQETKDMFTVCILFNYSPMSGS
jgi:hypothetical protein